MLVHSRYCLRFTKRGIGNMTQFLSDVLSFVSDFHMSLKDFKAVFRLEKLINN